MVAGTAGKIRLPACKDNALHGVLVFSMGGQDGSCRGL